MTYVIVGSCVKDDSSSRCPVDCIHPKPGDADFETAEQLYVDPALCIDCDACVEACPVDAIYPDFELPDRFAYALELTRSLRRARHDRADSGLMARPRVAIVGAGPAGAFAAAAVLRQVGDAESTCSSGCRRRGACCAAAWRPTTRRSSASRTPSTGRRSSAAAGSSATSKSAGTSRTRISRATTRR